MPADSARSMRAAGGDAPAVMNASARCNGYAMTRKSMPSTIKAPQRCVTPWSRSRPGMTTVSTLRKQTPVPALASSVHGKHQPLQ